MSKNSKKIKTILLKARYLESELELVEEDFKESQPEFREALYSRIKEVKGEDYSLNNQDKKEDKDAPKKDLAEEIMEIEKKPIPEEFKKVYRKVMLIVHPDRLGGIEDLEEIERMEKLAVSVTSAVDSENWYLLTSIAVELGIDLSDVPDSYIEGINKSCATMEKEINVFKKSFVVSWKNADEKAREELLDSYIELFV